VSGLHIGLIIDGLAGGGAERVVVTLAETMAQRGHRVTLVSLREEQAYPVPEGVEFLLVRNTYRGPLRRQTEIWRRAHQLDRLLRHNYGPHPFDLVISNLPKTDRIVAATPCLAHAWFCLHGAIAKTQLSCHKGLRRWLKRRQLRQTYDGRKLILVSAGLRSDILKQAGIRPQRLEVIPNPFDLARIRQQAAAPCPLDGEPFLLHVGRFHPLKRHDRLLAAFKLSGYPGKLVLLGTGSQAQQQALHQHADRLGMRERVLFAGFSNNPYPYLRAAQALVLSSDSEGFGNVLIEAMACGTPVISTRTPGPESILTGDLARGLSALNDIALADTIKQILLDPPVITDDYLNTYSLDNVLEQYLKLISPETETLHAKAEIILDHD
jgi:glycosyltransferase involved in cell wall biosynthesis